MAGIDLLVRRLALSEKQQEVASKASEYCRLATARLGAGGLGQFELCKGAACVELACMTLGVAVDSSLVSRMSGVSDKVYRNAKVAFQKVLGVTSKATARELCIKFGCARHDQSVRNALATFKERFVKSLPAAQQGHCDFGRPVFLAAAFYLVARKHKVQVDRMKLLDPLGVAATEFSQVCASMSDLCADLVGEGTRKRKAAEELPEEQRALIDRTGAADEGDVASESEDEVEDEGMVGHRVNAKKQRQREYEAWKQKMLVKPASGSSNGEEGKCTAAKGAAAAGAKAGSSGSGSGTAQKLTEKKLRQATLSFAASVADTAAGGEDGKADPATAAAVDSSADETAATLKKQAAAGSRKGKVQASAKLAAGAAKHGSSSSAGSQKAAALASKNR